MLSSFWSWKFRIAGIADPTTSQRAETQRGRFNGIDDGQKLQGVQEKGRQTLLIAGGVKPLKNMSLSIDVNWDDDYSQYMII